MTEYAHQKIINKIFQRKSLGILSSVDVDEAIFEQKSDNLRFTASLEAPRYK